MTTDVTRPVKKKKHIFISYISVLAALMQQDHLANLLDQEQICECNFILFYFYITLHFCELQSSSVLFLGNWR